MGTVEQLPVKLVPLTAEHWEWIRQRAHPVLCKDTTGIAALRGSKIVGALAFDSWSAGSCLGHAAIEDPRVTRRLLRALADYVFGQAGRKVMLGLTPADNERALRLNRGIGLREVYRIRDGYKPGVDYVLQEMRAEDCRWFSIPKQKVA